VNILFKALFKLEAAEYAQFIVQPFAISEWLSLAPSPSRPIAPWFKGPMYVTTGEFDYAACAGECCSSFAEAEPNLKFISPRSRMLESFMHLGADHGVNLGYNATSFYGGIIDLL
jgi:hypothetical protein